MRILDEFTSYHEELLDGDYDCVDRIVINAYFDLAQSGGGFRSWWRKLMGSDETLDRAHLERMAGRFKRRLEGYTKKNKIPFLYCEAGERKHEKASPYIPQDPSFKGVFLVLVGRAPAPVWEVQRNGKGQITNLYRKKNWPYVNHYHIHLMDPEWGHVTIRICGYPPFGAQVIANGHEWVERQARKRSLPVTKEGNCFTGGTDFQALNQIAKTLRAAHAVGRLTEACDRWLYSACLCFALDSEQQEQTKFQYQYWFYQLENSRHVARNMSALMCPRALCARSDSEASVAWTLGFGRPHNEVTHSAFGERMMPSANRRKEVLYAGTLLRPIADR
jgi:hypothetical protein